MSRNTDRSSTGKSRWTRPDSLQRHINKVTISWSCLANDTEHNTQRVHSFPSAGFSSKESPASWECVRGASAQSLSLISAIHLHFKAVSRASPSGCSSRGNPAKRRRTAAPSCHLWPREESWPKGSLSCGKGTYVLHTAVALQILSV